MRSPQSPGAVAAWHWPVYLLSVSCMLAVIFVNLGTHQLEIYDESRRAVNTLEMITGQAHPLVPTYDGLPDHWGTKPPLLIWAQVASVHCFGPGEFAIRFPAGLATSLVIILLIWFAYRQWQRPIIGLMAALITLSYWRFIGNHGARSGDYDAFLLLFSLGLLLFFARFVATGRIRYLILSATALLLAGWTKGIAGCFLLPAIGLYVLLDQRARPLLTNWRMYAAYATALLGIVSYYLLREQLDPGFLEIVFHNELGGRFAEVNEGHRQASYFYPQILLTDRTFAPFAWLFIPAATVGVALRQRYAGVALSALSAVWFIGLVSVAATKLYWYIVPALPLLALPVAVLLYELAAGLVRRLQDAKIARPAAYVGLALFCLFARPYVLLIEKVARPAELITRPSLISSYRNVIESGKVLPPYTVLTENYHAPVRYYVLKEQMKGLDVKVQPVHRLRIPLRAQPGQHAQLRVGQRVLICENEPWKWFSTYHDHRILQRREACTLVEVLGHRPDIDPKHLPVN